MKKILIFLLSIVSLSAFGQAGSQAVSGIKFRVNDTTAYQTAVGPAHSQGYSDIYWNNQATTPHWDIWNGSSYDHVFDFNGGGVSDKQDLRPDHVYVSGTTYTPTDADAGKIIHLTNATSTTVTLATGIDAKTVLTFVRDTGAGLVTFVDDGTSSLLAPNGETLETELAWATWIKDETLDNFYGVGQLGAAGGSQDLQDVLDNGGTASTTNAVDISATGADISFFTNQDGSFAASDNMTIGGTNGVALLVSGNSVTLTGASLATNGAILFNGILETNGDAGTAGQVLTSQGGASPPTWEDPGVGGVSSVFSRTGAVTAQSGDYTASQITNTPAGSISAITAQNAINELDTEKAPLASPALTGTPTAPTAAVTVDNTQIATTAHVKDVIPFVTPEMYGALGDGSTDDATAITNAFASGLPVYFGPKNYRINSGIALPVNAVAKGFNRLTTISTTQTTILMFTVNGFATIEGITFDGTDLSGQVGVYAADVISTSTEIGNKILDCDFTDLRYGIQAATLYSSDFTGAFQVTNCNFFSNFIGVWLQAGAEYNTFTNCKSDGNSSVGIRSDAGNNSWTGGQITGNVTGVQFNTGSNAGKNVFTGVAINHNTTAVLSNGITITSQFIGCNFISASKLDITSSMIRFIACYFGDTASQAWSFTNGSNLVELVNCRFGMTSANQPTVSQTGTVVQFTGSIWESGVIPSYAVGSIQGPVTQTGFAATGSHTNWTQTGSLTASSGTSQSYIGFNMTPTYNTSGTFTGTAAGFRYAATRTGLGGLSEYPIITNGGLHGIGTLTPTETMHIVGRGTTSATTGLLVQNSTPATVFTVRDDAAVQFGSSGSKPSIYPSAGTSAISIGGQSLTINVSNANANSLFVTQGLTSYANVLGLGGSFTNSSGTQSMSIFRIVNTINNTGTYAGTVIDLDINNTETSMTGTTHYGVLQRSTTALNGFATATPTSTLETGRSFGAATNSTSTDITLDASYYTVRVDASGASRTITLPAASGCTRRIYFIKKTDNSVNTVTIDGNGAETIDGATTQVIATQYGTFQIQSNGTSWDILSSQ